MQPTQTRNQLRAELRLKGMAGHAVFCYRSQHEMKKPITRSHMTILRKLSLTRRINGLTPLHTWLRAERAELSRKSISKTKVGGDEREPSRWGAVGHPNGFRGKMFKSSGWGNKYRAVGAKYVPESRFGFFKKTVVTKGPQQHKARGCWPPIWTGGRVGIRSDPLAP